MATMEDCFIVHLRLLLRNALPEVAVGAARLYSGGLGRRTSRKASMWKN